MRAAWHATRFLRLASSAGEEQRMGQIEELWCLYLAALVCWAFGYEPPKDKGNAVLPKAGGESASAVQEMAAEDAERSARDYLEKTNVDEWKELKNVAAEDRANTRGLLECTRLKVGEMGMGGLLNGAEDVLFRLVEGRGEFVAF